MARNRAVQFGVHVEATHGIELASESTLARHVTPFWGTLQRIVA